MARAQSISQIDQVTQHNTASAEESASASEELSSNAAQARQLLRRFRATGAGEGGVRRSLLKATPRARSRAATRSMSGKP